MNSSRRLLSILVVLCLFALIGCSTSGGQPTPIIITATPAATVVITATPDPTPTQESGGQYIIVNSNPYFAGPTTDFALESDDAQRRQTMGRGYEPVARWYYESGVRVAPWIFWHPLNDGSGRARQSMEFTQIAGEFGIQTQVTLTAGQCYVMKQIGYLGLSGSGDMRNLALGARVYLNENGSALELQEQAFPGEGSYEIAWRLRPLQDVTTFVEIYLMVRWAEFSAIEQAVASFLDVDAVEITDQMMMDYYEAQTASINQIDSFQVVLAPQSECPSGATWEW